MAPHETKVLGLERDLLRTEQGAMSSFGAISIEHNGEPGALVARAMALDVPRGFSLPIQFTDPATAKSNNLQGAGLRLGSAGRESLSPTVVVHNAGGTETALNGRVPYTTIGGNQGEIILPQVQLSPGETEVIDIAPLVNAHGLTGEVTAAGLEFQYTGELGSVITSAFSVSRSGNQVFRVPLWDIAAQRSGTGGYPWYIEGDSSTVIYIKNVTDETQNYRMYLKLTGGDYVFPLKTVAPHQTTVIDVRKLRDTQVPDVNGQTIPAGETRGQVQWSLTGGVDRVLIGRSEQVDLVRGISSNYACQNCCPNNFYDGWLTPAQSTAFEGDQFQFIAMQQDMNCYGQVYPAYQVGTPSFTSSDLSICNPGNTGTTTGVGPGEAIINGVWTGDAWLSSPTGVCDYTPAEVLREAICDILSRRVDSVSPERALIGQPVDVTIKGSGFGTGTPTVSAGSGIAVSNIQLINSGEVRARFTIGVGASAGNQAVSVTTSTGLTTTALGNFFVQIPSSLNVQSVSVLPTGTTGDHGCAPSVNFGIQIAIVYQVLDQASPARPINSNGMLPQETFTNIIYNGVHQADSSLQNVGPTYVSGTTLNTTLSGTFKDAPFGNCSNGTFTLTIDQNLIIAVGSSSYPVRRNSFTTSSNSSGQGSISNSLDISASR